MSEGHRDPSAGGIKTEESAMIEDRMIRATAQHPAQDTGSVGRLAPDPGLDHMTRLAGRYLGNSPDRAYWRLYLTEGFDRYLKFRKSDTIDAKRQPDGRIIVWLVPRAVVEEVEAAPGPEEFLQGDLQRHLTGVARWAGIRRVLLLEAGTCTGGGGGGGGKQDGGSVMLKPGSNQCQTTSDGGPGDQPSIDQC
jgi:hypothetical protein